MSVVLPVVFVLSAAMKRTHSAGMETKIEICVWMLSASLFRTKEANIDMLASHSPLTPHTSQTGCLLLTSEIVFLPGWLKSLPKGLGSLPGVSA